MYLPDYLEKAQTDLENLYNAVENLAENAEESAEYNDRLHPFHTSAVAFYNALVSMSITLSGFIAGYVSEG